MDWSMPLQSSQVLKVTFLENWRETNNFSNDFVILDFFTLKGPDIGCQDFESILLIGILLD
jgi:hypothetical protein